MTILSYFFILLLSILTGCDRESYIDYSSFNIKPEIISSQEHKGFIITDTCSPFYTPIEFENLERTSKALINSNWLSNPHYLEDINHLVYLFSNTNIKNSDIFIQTLNNSALIYKKNMTEVNMLKRKIQTDINYELDYYQQAIASLNTHLYIIQTHEQQQIENISIIKSNIRKKQQYYTKLRRSLRENLQTILHDNDLIFDIISDIKFKYTENNTLYCSKYLGAYQQLVSSSSHACIYYNKEDLIAKVPTKHQQQINVTLNKYIPKLWDTMVQLNGYFESDYNKQVFEHYLQKDLIIANNNLAIKRTLNHEQQSYHSIEKQLNRLKQLNQQMSTIMNSDLLDDNNKVNISTSEFYKELSPLLINGRINDPIINFSLLYNNKNLIKNFTHEYATKILNEYPKILTFNITSNGTFTLPKIREHHYKIVIDIKDSYSITYNYNSQNILASPPTKLTQKNPNTMSMENNLNQIISQQLFNKWANS